MGKSRTGTDGGQHSAKGKRQVLRGSCAVCPSIQQRDVEPLNSCPGTAGGVLHLRGLLNG
jgi:hypothetical protein